MNRKCISLLLILVIVWLAGCGTAQNNPNGSDTTNENKKHTEEVQTPDGSADTNTENDSETDNPAPIRDVHIVPEEYREIITQRAEETLMRHNAHCESMETMEKENNLQGWYQPRFTGYEILLFQLQDSFTRDGVDFEIYHWDIVFHTDDPNASQGTWIGEPFVDEQYRVHYYDEFAYFVVYRENGQMKWDFFHSDLYGQHADAKAQLFDHLAQWLIGEVETLPVLTLSDEENDALYATVLNDLKTGWWMGGKPFADDTYEAGVFDCVYRETVGFTEKFYGYAHYFRFDENGNCIVDWGAPSIITLNADTKVTISVWWPGDGAAYVEDILKHFPEDIAWSVAEPQEGTYQVIRERQLEKAKECMVPVTPADTETRLATLVAEDIKHIVARRTPSAAEIVETLSTAMANKIEHKGLEIEDIFWDLEFFLTNETPGLANEWVWLKAGLEENIVEISHSRSYSQAVKLVVEDAVLYQLVRGTEYTKPVIDEEAFARYGDVLKERAQKTVDDSRKNLAGTLMLPYTGYEIVRFEMIDGFETNGARYEVYRWDAAFWHDDPERVVWAGGMWLDSDLRVRGLEEQPYFVVCIFGGTVVHDFFFWDLYAESEEQVLAQLAEHFAPLTTGGGTPLTAEELAFFQEYTRSDRTELNEWGGYVGYATEISCFFTSYYTDPRDINAVEFLCYCPSEYTLEWEDEEEFRFVQQKLDWRVGEDEHLATLKEMPVPCHRYSRVYINEILMRYAGITIEDMHTDWTQELLYIPETDCFYTFTSDFGPGSFTPYCGVKNGNIVTLWSKGSKALGSDAAMLVLQKSGENWHIVSHTACGEE